MLCSIIFTRTTTNAIVFDGFFESLAFWDYFAHSGFKCFTRLKFNGGAKNPSILIVVCANRSIVSAQ